MSGLDGLQMGIACHPIRFSINDSTGISGAGGARGRGGQSQSKVGFKCITLGVKFEWPSARVCCCDECIM